MNLPRRQFVKLLRCAVFLGLIAQQVCAEPVQPIDEARTESAGIRKLTSKHLVLYTDAPSSKAVDSLPAEFDKAVPQWAAYFGIDPAKTADWQPREFEPGPTVFAEWAVDGGLDGNTRRQKNVDGPQGKFLTEKK